MIICKKCSTESSDDSLFCSTCGAKLESGNNPTAEEQFTPVPAADCISENSDISPKSRLIALVLAALTGLFGIHHFYAGKTSVGVALAVMTTVSFLSSWLGIGVLIFFIPAIWSFLDIIVILTGNYKDGKGKKVKNWLSK